MKKPLFSCPECDTPIPLPEDFSAAFVYCPRCHRVQNIPTGRAIHTIIFSPAFAIFLFLFSGMALFLSRTDRNWIHPDSPDLKGASRMNIRAAGMVEAFSGIHQAVIQSDFGLVKAYLRDPRTVCATDSSDRAPIHLAAALGQASMAALLLAHGANLGASDQNGNQPIHYAGSRKMVEFLLENGCNLHALDKNGDTPLHHGVFRGKPDAVRALLHAGARVNETDHHGETPLHKIVFSPASFTRETAEILLNAGADIFARCKEGNTPYLLAILRKNDLVADLLLKAGDAASRTLPVEK